MGQQTSSHAFNPDALFLTLFNQVVTGFAKGTFITIAYDSDFFEDMIGANGDVARILSVDRRASVKFTLQSDSPFNDILSDAVTNDERTGTNTTIIQCKDSTGTSLASGKTAWVKKKPDQPFSSTEPSTRDWEIRVADLHSRIGGR